MSEAAKAGKARYLCISECTAATLRRAHAMHPMAAAQCEYAPFTLHVEDAQVDVRAACAALGVALVAYSSAAGSSRASSCVTLPASFLVRCADSEGAEDPDTLSDGDMRKTMAYPRFERANFARAMRLVDTLGAVGARHGATPAQVALAWLLAQGPNVAPIPGTTDVDRVKKNARAARIELAPEDLQEIRDAVESAGLHKIMRNPEVFESYNFIDTPPLQ